MWMRFIMCYKQPQVLRQYRNMKRVMIKSIIKKLIKLS